MAPEPSTEELLDVVSPAGVALGPRPRSVVHREGLWHPVFHCLVVRSGSPARVLLQRRSLTARSFPGLLDLSVTGHLAAGERPLDGLREMREELGLDVAPERLVALGTRLLADDSGEGGANRELAHVYLLRDDTPLAALVLDPGEVAGAVELTVARLQRLLADPTASVTATSVGTDGVVSDVVVAASELVPSIGAYWAVLSVMAERFALGEAPLGI